MKVLPIVTTVGGFALIALGGVMTVTNPGSEAYQEYATEKLTIYLKENVCSDISEQLGNFLETYCTALVDTGRPQIGEIIAQTTQRQNYLLFSIYETELAIASPLPGYRVQTVGVLQNFYIYQIERL